MNTTIKTRLETLEKTAKPTKPLQIIKGNTAEIDAWQKANPGFDDSNILFLEIME